MDSIIVKILPTLFVAFGGALGASARFWVREYLPAISGTEFPFSTLVVNVVGCFLAGFVYLYIENQGPLWSMNKVLFFFVGFLGAFTTFSAFALDSFLLHQQGETLKLIVNITANCLLCLASVFVGAWLGGRISAS